MFLIFLVLGIKDAEVKKTEKKKKKSNPLVLIDLFH